MPLRAGDDSSSSSRPAAEQGKGIPSSLAQGKEGHRKLGQY